MGEKATLATQRELRALRAAGQASSLLIGASMRDASQVASLAGVDVYTMPPKVAAEYRKSPAAVLASQVDRDPPVQFANGVKAEDFNGETLWDVPDSFRHCVAELMKRDLERLTPDELQAHFAHAGFGDFLPRWSDEQIRTAIADGKIPVFSRWRGALASRKVGLDALMNLSALMSFATDEQALDERIGKVTSDQ